MDGQGNLEKTWKVREKSGIFTINGCYSIQKLYLFYSGGNTCNELSS